MPCSCTNTRVCMALLPCKDAPAVVQDCVAPLRACIRWSSSHTYREWHYAHTHHGMHVCIVHVHSFSQCLHAACQSAPQSASQTIDDSVECIEFGRCYGLRCTHIELILRVGLTRQRSQAACNTQLWRQRIAPCKPARCRHSACLSSLRLTWMQPYGGELT